MNKLSHITTARPVHRATSQEILETAQSWLDSSPNEQELFKRLVASSRIEGRGFALPVHEILSLRGVESRAEIFEREGSRLAIQVTELLLEQTKLSPSDFSAIIFTSVTVPTIPSIDVAVINRLEFPANILRIPLYQYGCAGGAMGLLLADEIASTQGRVLLLSVELCSLNFQRNDLSGGNILGSVLFADGAAACVIEPENSRPEKGGLIMRGSESSLVPDSSDIMGYDLRNDGPHLRLKRELPQVLMDHIRKTLPIFLHSHGLASPNGVKWWLLHPGGVRILSAMEEEFGLLPEQTRWSWDTLRDYGNMSSASLLFVAEQFKSSGTARRGDLVLMVGVGPGLTVVYQLLECA